MVIVAKYLCKDIEEIEDFQISKENKSMLKEFFQVYLQEYKMEVYLDSPAKLTLESPISTIPPEQTFMLKLVLFQQFLCDYILCKSKQYIYKIPAIYQRYNSINQVKNLFAYCYVKNLIVTQVSNPRALFFLNHLADSQIPTLV